jgi:hypothetical protein
MWVIKCRKLRWAGRIARMEEVGRLLKFEHVKLQ